MNRNINSRVYNLLLLAIIIIAFGIAYTPVLKGLIQTWANSDEYSHGFFIIPISLFIVWKKREHLANIQLQPSIWGLLITAISLLIYIVGYFAGVTTLCSLTIIPFWLGIVLFLYGPAMTKALIFPISLLFFMIPIPAQIFSYLTIPLQLFVSKMSVILSSSFGVPIFGEGNVIHLKNRTLEVVEACSGLRSLVTLLTLTLLFGYFSLNSNLLRGVLFLSAIPIAIIVNIFRVLMIVLSFHYYDFDLTLDKYHTWFGLVIFSLALIIIFTIKEVLGRWDVSANQEF